MTSRPVLEVRNLSVSFGDDAVKVVDDVSFQVGVGETVAIVGESGSGKSMTALSIMRLLPSSATVAASGRLLLDGVDLLELSERDMRRVRGRDIAMIFQEPMSSLNPVRQIGDQIIEPAVIHKLVPDGASRLDLTLNLLSSVGIPEPGRRLHAYPHELSGGMRQRVMIAMAMCGRPRLIVADEPTTALDVTTQAQVLELLREIARETSSSMMLITHDLGVVARYASRVHVMYAGRFVEVGTAEQIFHDPRHPYTIALLEAMPRLDRPFGERMKPIEGQPPDFRSLPKGCSFSPRCSRATDQCRSEKPPLRERGEGHAYACWVQ